MASKPSNFATPRTSRQREAFVALPNYGIADKPVDARLPFAQVISEAALARGFSRSFLYAIAWRETLCDEAIADPATFISGDGGHGVFQLTSSFPQNWQDVGESAMYAIDNFLFPAVVYLADEGLRGDDLVKVAAAAFNAGLTAAWNAHLAGNVDAVTTNNYGAGVLAIYHTLVNTGEPD